MNGATTKRLLVLLLLFTSPSFAAFFSKGDRGRTGPAILKMEPGVRSSSLGGAYVSLADDTDALFWNPAGIQRASRSELLLGHARIFEDQTQDYLGYLHPSWRAGERETWGIHAAYLAVDGFDLVQDGAPAGQANPWEGLVGLSYARPFRYITWGVTGKVAQKVFPGETGRSFALDAGVQGTFESVGTDWGLVMANLGTPMTLGNQKVSSPLVVRGGASRSIPMGRKNQLRLSGQLDVPWDTGLLGRLGAEFVLPGKEWAIAFRAGVRTSGQSRITAGLGFERNPLGINYGYTPSETLGATHRLDMTFRFGVPLAQEVKRKALFADAQSAWSQGRAAQTADILEDVRTISPHFYPALRLSQEVNRRIEESLNPDTLFNLGTHAFHEKDFERAGDYFRKLVILDPTYPEGGAWLKKAESEWVAEKNARAREEMKRGRELERKSTMRAARDDQRLERWAAALSGWRKVLSRFPGDAESQSGVTLCRGKIRSLAEASEQKGDRENAILFYRILQGDLPDRETARRIETLEKETQADSTVRSQAIYLDGVRAYDAGDLKQALVYFEEAARLNPHDSTMVRARDRVKIELERVIELRK